MVVLNTVLSAAALAHDIDLALNFAFRFQNLGFLGGFDP